MEISWEQVKEYLESLKIKGCVPGSIQSYRHNLEQFYQALPEGKVLEADTLPHWRDSMREKGYKPSTINQRLVSVNCLLAYLKLWEYQLPLCPDVTDTQPELTRSEYLRLLSAARVLRKKRSYLLVKVFACTGIAVRELPKLTVEALKEGRLALTGGEGRIIPLTGPFSKELLDYARQEGIKAGPVFVTRNGRNLNRTGVTAAIQRLAQDARVAPEKCNPRCLQKLYRVTQEQIRQNIALLVDQAHDRLLEQEQLTIGWEVI